MSITNFKEPRKSLQAKNVVVSAKKLKEPQKIVIGRTFVLGGFITGASLYLNVSFSFLFSLEV